MTEEQRMEEGRRMFQIFAARMFEQRVLTAYKEKVAKERQQKLLEELEEESRQVTQRKAKKAKEAQKRKDKAAKKKEALAEEKARKEAEKAAEAEARLAEEARKAEEQRLKAEEKRKKKEAQKKAEEEERLRKEAERQRRIHEQKEKQAEQERKIREAKEREKKLKDEAKQKEKEAKEKEAKEKEAKEKEAKERKERETKEREAKERKEREARERKEQQDRERDRKAAQARDRSKDGRRAKSDREPKEQAKREDRQSHSKGVGPAPPATITLAKRPAPHATPATLPALPQQPTAAAAAAPSSFVSPQIPVATPALPKAPTPVRPRQVSQQEASASHTTSYSASTTSQNPSPHPMTPTHASPGPIGSSSKPGSASTQGGVQQPSQAASPLGMPSKALPTHSSSINVPPMAIPFPPPGISQVPPGFGGGSRMQPESHFNPFNPGFRSPNMGSVPSAVGVPPSGRGFPMSHPHPPPGFGQQAESPFGSINQGFAAGPAKDNGASHSRHPSGGGYDPGSSTSTSSQLYGRPTPIGRPSSVVHGQRRTSGSPAISRASVDFVDHHLGSSALLDESDLQELPGAPPRPTNAAPGARLPVPTGAYGSDSLFPSGHNPWGPTPIGQGSIFSPPPGFGASPGASAWAPPALSNSAFGMQAGIGRQNQPRTVTIRQMLCRACKELADIEDGSADPHTQRSGRAGYIPLSTIRAHMNIQNSGDPPTELELVDICDTEGNLSNGGGSFDVQRDEFGRVSIRWSGAGGQLPLLQRPVGAGPSEIGSPVVGGSSLLMNDPIIGNSVFSHPSR